MDGKINAGTTAANCQPKHTRDELESELDSLESSDFSLDDDDDDMTTSRNGNGSGNGSGSITSVTSSEEKSRKQRRAERKAADKAARKEAKAAVRRKKQAAENAEEQKKMGYFQMARLGYQELVNAIIRPPRADYKVCVCDYLSFVIICSDARVHKCLALQMLISYVNVSL